jgi:sulfatase modifying factor 1
MPNRREVLQRLVRGVGWAGVVAASQRWRQRPQAVAQDGLNAVSPFAQKWTGTRAGEERDDNGLRLKLVWCPPGSFRMGSPRSELGRDTDEEQVEVTLTRGFWLGKYEVTEEEWEQVMGTSPWKQGRGRLRVERVARGEPQVIPPAWETRTFKSGPRYPARFVRWEETGEFLDRLTAQERQAGRLPATWEYKLPTEAQWEYACRAGTESAYSCGDAPTDLRDFAWWGGVIGQGTASLEPYAHEVGGKRPNPWGLHDLHGNLWEWCRDGYQARLPGGRDPLNRQTADRVARGGGWDFGADRCRSAFRYRLSPGFRDYGQVGFRIACCPVR